MNHLLRSRPHAVHNGETLRRLWLLIVLFSFAPSANADCEALFQKGKRYVFEGSTIAGIKNDFSSSVTLILTPESVSRDAVIFGQGELHTDRLPGGVLRWTQASDQRWGNQCLSVQPSANTAGFIALSWDPDYRHPNVHGVLEEESGRWVLRGYLDNAAQQFHEAAIELWLSDAS